MNTGGHRASGGPKAAIILVRVLLSFYFVTEIWNNEYIIDLHGRCDSCLFNSKVPSWKTLKVRCDRTIFQTLCLELIKWQWIPCEFPLLKPTKHILRVMRISICVSDLICVSLCKCQIIGYNCSQNIFFVYISYDNDN